MLEASRNARRRARLHAPVGPLEDRFGLAARAEDIPGEWSAEAPAALASSCGGAWWIGSRATDIETEDVWRDLRAVLEPWVRQMSRGPVILGAIIYAAFFELDRWVIPDAISSAATIRFGVVCPLLLTLVALSYHPRFTRLAWVAAAGALLAGGLGILALMALVPAETGALYLPGVLLALTGCLLFRLPLLHTSVVCGVHLLAYVLVGRWLQPIRVEVFLANLAQLSVFSSLVCVGAWQLQRWLARELVLRNMLDAERMKADMVLGDILPEAITARLKEGERNIADHHASITIVFADIVEFTSLCEQVSAPELVTLLTNLFSAFDRIAQRHGLEKIKTVGDAYIVASGLDGRSDPRANAAAAAALAQDMIAEVARYRRPDGGPLELRIGINTGPAVAGVLGVSKLAYDMWGETVNVASRMQAHAPPGSIQISESTRVLLGKGHELEPRGEITLKGGRTAQTWLLSRRYTESAAQQASFGVRS